MGNWKLFTWIRIFLIVIFSVFRFNAYAQLKCSIKHYSTEDGLSQDGILCIAKDKEGFMWFGTSDGINRFDGKGFITYKARPGDSSSLSNNKIRNIIEDRAGYLWVKTYDNKVYRFDKRTEKFLSIPQAPGKQSNSVIEKIVPSRSGDMWLLTVNQGMLCAVNDEATGQLKIYRYNKSLKGDFKLCSNKVNFLFEDSRRRVWVGTLSGLSCFTKGNTQHYNPVYFANQQTVFGSDNDFNCVAEHNGTMYFGTTDGKLISFNSSSRVFTTTTIAKNTRLNAILVSKSGNIYVTSDHGLAIVDPKTWAISYATVPESAIMRSLYEDRNGKLWIEPENDGAMKYDPSTQKFKLYTQKTDTYTNGHHTNYSVFETSNGVLWTILRGGGFGYYDPEKDDIAYFYDEPGSPNQQFSNIISAYYADDTDVLWLSGHEGGVNKVIFQPQNFRHEVLVADALNKSRNDVRSLLEDKQGRIWAGNKYGELFVYKNGRKIDNVFVNMPQSQVGSIYTITEGSDGTIWLGTKGRGLLMAVPLNADHSKYKVTRFIPDPNDLNSISNKQIYSVFEDNKHRIWVGTFGGGLNLVVKDGDRVTFKNYQNAFKNYPIASCNVIRHLNQDSRGRIWIATNNGLVIFNPDKGGPNNYTFSRYFKVPGDLAGLGNNSVQVIHKDRAGQMWVGTFGGGLYKQIADADGKLRFKFYTTADGLPNDIILGMVDDNRGNLWIATENGLSRFEPRTEVFNNYGAYEGITDYRFAEAACLRSRSGLIYFGCLDGFISFHPDKVRNKEFYANMALTNLSVNNENVQPGTGGVLTYALDKTDHLTLNYDQNIVGIDYTVLDYRASNKVLYAYILEGSDKGWNFVKNKRQATYTNLSPGTYTFRVKSVSTDMFTNTPQKTLIITILPPPWLTIWAYLVYFILLVIAIIIARRIITTMIKLRNNIIIEHKLTELKLGFFTNISHELKTPLTLIVSPLKEIEKSNNLSAKERDYINVVNKNTSRMIRFINQLLDFRKAQNGKMRLKVAKVDIVALMHELSGYFMQLAQEKNISLTVNADVDELYAWIDREKIDIVIYNLLSNAFKFSMPNTAINVDVRYIEGEKNFSIAVTDQGSGVPENKLNEIFELYYESDKASMTNLKGTGIGLALSKELIVSHNGSIKAINNPGGGMCFLIELQLSKDHFNTTEVDFEEEAHSPRLEQPVLIPHYNDDLNNITEHLHAKPNVLVVEDNADLRKFLCSQLEPHYLVKDAADGVEGLKLAGSLLPDLIISDVMMPNMDGIEMLNRLKNDIATSHIPVILLTARSSVENQIEGLKYGADFYITKPFHTDFILASVESLIKQRRQLFENLLNAKNLVQLSPGEILITSKDEQLLKDTIKIVEESLADPDFNIDSVAISVGLGRTTFYKKLKSLTGFAPVEFVRDMRLKRAKQLLDAGEHTISEIAYMVGFSSSGYFSTCFKEQYKTSPTEYLKSRKVVDDKLAH
ncbi:response regulator [Mucilaginibacter sp. HMF5004]|uniref:hybrid sensor histidine kinase/response regulator transcription factor n=1 Tax=Mucilaginibacter rivuli TaxID=2857527 RepID=UPI001C5FD737|nr:hybrid sensor histidine kinase/response regulator transcription factor [Mucilaginibacter rivuli]MBW4889957.1 response regulator [Mucilaginibacter rivuli]